MISATEFEFFVSSMFVRPNYRKTYIAAFISYESSTHKMRY